MDDIDEPKFTIADDGDRAKVETYIHISKFRLGDQVYYQSTSTATREGPYTIESVPSTGNYTLCLTDGKSVKNGEVIEERYLSKA